MKYNFLVTRVGLILALAALIGVLAPRLTSAAFVNAANIQTFRVLPRHDGNTAQTLSLAETLSQQAIVIHATAGGWFALARARALAGDPTGAAQAYERGLILEPDNSSTWFLLGKIYAESGKHPPALAAWRRAQAASYFRQLGFLQWEAKEYTGAAETLGLGHEIYPDDAIIAFELAQVYQALGNYEQAILLYTQAAQIESADKCLSWNRLGAIYFTKQLWDLAEQSYQGCASNPQASADERANAFAGLANIALYVRQDHSAARSYIAQALEQESRQKEALTRRGEIELAEGNVREALIALQSALELNFDDPYVLALVGVAWSRAHNLCVPGTTAVQDAATQMAGGQISAYDAGTIFATARDDCPENEYYLRAWVVSYIWAGDEAGERAALEWVVRRKPDAGWARARLSQVGQ